MWPIAPDTNYNSHIEEDTTSMFILQLSCILHMVGTWGTTTLRVMATSPTEELGMCTVMATSPTEELGMYTVLNIKILFENLPSSIRRGHREGAVEGDSTDPPH